MAEFRTYQRNDSGAGGDVRKVSNMKVFVKNIMTDQVHVAELREEPGKRPELLINDKPVFFYGYQIMRQEKGEEK